MAFLKRFLRSLPLLLVSPLLVLLSALALFITDVVATCFSWSRKNSSNSFSPPSNAASVVIPNWNGRDLLAKYLPSVVTALAANPANEIVVVDNGSTDGSAEFIRSTFPQVKVVALPANLGFGGGSNRGFCAAAHPLVALINSE